MYRYIFFKNISELCTISCSDPARKAKFVTQPLTCIYEEMKQDCQNENLHYKYFIKMKNIKTCQSPKKLVQNK